MHQSILRKESDHRDSIEYQETLMNVLRNTEMKQSIMSQKPISNKIASLYKLYQESEKIEFGTIENIVKTMSNKFKEYIIDEDEAEVIRRFVKIATESHDLSLSDRLDLVYKYAKLYFKYLDKQFYHESDTNFKEDAKEESKGIIEDSNLHSKRYEEVIDWLFDSISKILDQCDNDTTKLDGYYKKLFLLMTSMYIVSLKFPHKYGVLSLSPEKRLGKVGELEIKLMDCILTIKYKGNT